LDEGGVFIGAGKPRSIARGESSELVEFLPSDESIAGLMPAA
jgi:hypothetical protein